MPAPRKSTSSSLELSRLTLASLAVWLAVTCLVACNQMLAPASGTATASATDLVADSAADSTTSAAIDGQLALATPAAIEVPANFAAEEPQPQTKPASFAAVVDGDEVAVNRPAAVAEAAVVEAAAVISAAKVAAPGSRFVFSADEGGQLLASKLTPPSQFEFRAVPYVSEPKPWRTLQFDPLPRDVASLTRTIIPSESRTIPRTALAGLSLHPLDLPSLPREIAFSAPTPLVVNPQPLSYVSSPNAEHVPFLAVSAAPPKEKIDAASDPSRPSTALSMFQTRLLTNQLATPFLKLAIPDPFEQIRAIQLNSKLPDLDPALFPPGRPSQPHFPVIELPTEQKK